MHLANIIDQDFDNNNFPEGAKITTVCPIYETNERDKIENYRPVSILNCFSKVYEKFLLKEFKQFLWKLFSQDFMQLIGQSIAVIMS